MFEWDDEKATTNWHKHGVSFKQAQLAFADPFGLVFEDDRFDYGEARFIWIGAAEGRLLTVVYAERDDCIRIISARRAEPQERRMYHDEQ
jgi:uncharacterized DUF497 family protein